MKKIKSLFFNQFCLLVLLLGCQQSTTTTPLSTPLPTATFEPLATIVLTAEPTPVANEPTPFEQTVVAFSQITSFRVQSSMEGYRDGGILQRDEAFILGEAAQLHSVIHRPSGTMEDIRCVSQPQVRCMGQVGKHPFVRQSIYEALVGNQAKGVEITLSGRTIVTVENEDSEVKVDWVVETFPLQAVASEAKAVGQSWLDAESYLLLREVIEWRTLTDDSLILREERMYSDYNQPLPNVIIPEPVSLPAVPTAVPPAQQFNVREETWGQTGKLFVPEGEGSFPALLMLHGSEGRLVGSGPMAQQFAEAGFVALADCYFRCPFAPDHLKNISLDAMLETLQMLRDRPDTNDILVVVGMSRGAELALILGVLESEIDAVVSLMGSPEVHGALSSEYGPAWLYQDTPLPFFEIPIEEINSPVLLMHGENDHLWPATYAYHIADRLMMHERPFELIVLPERGHDIYQPSDVDHVIDFLNRSLP